MSFQITYWLKIILGLIIVSLPFLIAASRKKISWTFFWSWTLTSVFVTLTFFLIKSGMNKHLDGKAKFTASMILGLMFAGVGIYLRTIRSPNFHRIGWLFILFAAIWIGLTIRL